MSTLQHLMLNLLGESRGLGCISILFTILFSWFLKQPPLILRIVISHILLFSYLATYRATTTRSHFHNHAQQLKLSFTLLYKCLAAQQKFQQFGFHTHTTALWPMEQSSILHVCQVWLSSGPPEFSTFSYCAWLWNWLINSDWIMNSVRLKVASIYNKHPLYFARHCASRCCCCCYCLFSWCTNLNANFPLSIEYNNCFSIYQTSE